MEPEDSFGRMLKRRRRHLDLTQQQLGECASCSTITIRKFEADERRPSRQLAELLADCLDIHAPERELFLARARGVEPAATAEEPDSHPTVGRLALPQPATPLIGREQELAQITDRLADPNCRLLTLVGPGGAGKTRLALAVAQAQTPYFADSVAFTSLAAVQQAEEVPQAIARSLALSLNGMDPSARQLGRYLQRKRMLLVLDNFEQRMDAADLLPGWLQQAPGVKWLVTSRERLNLAEEWLFPVQGFVDLRLGMELFTTSARRVDPNFSLEGQEGSVAEICRLVGSLPLAIELAAGWTAGLSCDQIVTEIRKSFDFLSTSLRNVPQRHRSIRSLFDQTWKLLELSDQNILMRLSVFRGGFASEEAAIVAGATLPLLRILNEKSLVLVVGRGRYDLHELTRRYAAEKLSTSGQETVVRQQHFQSYLTLAETAEPHLYGPDAVRWFERLEEEATNFQAALDWAKAGDESNAALRLVNALWWYWFRRGNWQAAEGWITAVLKQVDPSASPSRARALLNLSTLIALQGRYGEASQYLEIVLEMAHRLEDPETQVAALHVLGQATPDPEAGIAAHLQAEELWKSAALPHKSWVLAHLYLTHGELLQKIGRYGEAEDRYRQSLELYRQMGNVDTIAYPLGNLGRLALKAGELSEARDRIEESVALSRAIGNRQGVGDWLISLARVMICQDDAGEAEGYLQEALSLHDEMGNLRGRGEALSSLAFTAYLQRKANEAAETIQHSLAAYQELYSQTQQSDEFFSPSAPLIVPDLVDCVLVAGLIAADQGQTERAVTLLSIAERLRGSIGYVLDPPFEKRISEVTSDLQNILSPARYQFTWEASRNWALDSILEYALWQE